MVLKTLILSITGLFIFTVNQEWYYVKLLSQTYLNS